MVIGLNTSELSLESSRLWRREFYKRFLCVTSCKKSLSLVLTKHTPEDNVVTSDKMAR